MSFFPLFAPLIGGFDPDAESFFTRASITNATQKAAVNQLVLSLKAASLWATIIAIYPYVGGNATAHSKNLRANLYNITWNGGVTHNVNGITGDGSTGYGICIGLAGNTVFPHLGCMGAYIRVAHSIIATQGRYSGIYDGASALYGFERVTLVGLEQNRHIAGDVSNVATDGSAVAALKFVAGNRSLNTRMDLYANGVSIANNTTNDTSSPAAVDMTILALNNNGVSRISFVNGNLALSLFASSYSAAQHVTLASIIQTFQTTLGRQV